MKMLISGLRDFTEVNKLTPRIVNKLIKRIEFHNNDKSSGYCFVQVDIYFTALGLFSSPTEDTLRYMNRQEKVG